MDGPNGKVVHAEMKIGDSRFMMADEMPGMSKSPQSLGGTRSSLMIYTDQCDALYDRAVKAGATSRLPPTDMFWGDRYSKVTDPFGHEWSISTHREPAAHGRQNLGRLFIATAPSVTEDQRLASQRGHRRPARTLLVPPGVMGKSRAKARAGSASSHLVRVAEASLKEARGGQTSADASECPASLRSKLYGAQEELRWGGAALIQARQDRLHTNIKEYEARLNKLHGAGDSE